MRRVLQALLVLTLLVVAILAKTFDSLVAAAPSSATTGIGSANVRFEGSVTQLIELNGVLIASGTAVIQDSTVSLPALTWQASASVPFRRTSNGTLQLPRQGQLRIRLIRAGTVHYTLVASLADIAAILNNRNGQNWVVVEGEVEVFPSEGGSWDDAETEIALTLAAPTLDSTFMMETVIFDWTRFPITQTPNAPHTQAPTSPPTFAAPGL